jgi:hydrogenase-4 transcriptional activator
MASLFVPTWPGMEEAILVHSGPEPAVPELRGLASAFEFARTHAQRPAGPVAPDGTAAVPSELAGGTLLAIPLVSGLWQHPLPPPLPSSEAEPPATCGRHGRRASDQHAFSPTAGWVALRFPVPENPGHPTPHGTLRMGASQSALDLAARLASLYLHLYGSLADALTGLPGRAVLRTVLRQELVHARAERTPLSVVLFSPNDFAQVNITHGRATGDLVLREVVLRAQSALRRTDLLCRNGAATFAVPLRRTGGEAALIVADKLHAALARTPYLGGRVAVTFSAGIATFSTDDLALADPVDFIGRAEAALVEARRTEGTTTCAWRAGATEAQELADGLRHAFTGDQDRDYRNMGLLWDAVGLLAASDSPGELARRVVSQLRRGLAASLVALFEPGERGLAFQYGLARGPGGTDDQEVPPSSLGAERIQAVHAAADTRAPVWKGAAPDAADESIVCAVPLMVDDALVGVLLLAGAPEQMKLDESDLAFVKRFGGPLGLALERARHAERRRQQEEAERQRLVGELKGLRTAVRQAKLIHVSPQMEELVVAAHRIADTDATVLITGESGTGKEMLAQTIHQMSGRRGRAFVIVDCGAIPATLIESELFGHERGAFTGALTRSPGRLVQAEGGTVLLDEIGELPLDVQSKLLRFVQEKQFTTVGSSVPRRVDVRVLAATNRELAQEVASGRFRADLYHRLNVFALPIPPLRERRDDILELARHFLQVFTAKYQKPVRVLGAEVEAALVRYPWPGNVRELQNRMMRAVIMSEGETLGVEALSLPSAGPAPPLAVVGSPGRRDLLALEPVRPTDASADGGPPAWTATAVAPLGGPAAWSRLRAALASVVSRAASEPGGLHPPLGRWLANDLVLAAFAASGRVARHGAARLGVPETTFMRHLQRARREASLVRRPADWQPVTQAVEQLVHTAPAEGTNVLDAAEASLLETIDRDFRGNVKAGASLLGTTVVTFRRRLAALPPSAARQSA